MHRPMHTLASAHARAGRQLHLSAWMQSSDLTFDPETKTRRKRDENETKTRRKETKETEQN